MVVVEKKKKKSLHWCFCSGTTTLSGISVASCSWAWKTSVPFFMSSPYDAAQAMSDCLIKRALVSSVTAIVPWSSVVHISWIPVAWRC